jgi:DHA1 family inner membrane transport protein
MTRTAQARAVKGATPMPWIALLTLSAAAFVTVTAELLPASVLLPMSDGLGVKPSTAGMLVSAWAVTVAVLSLPLVRWTRRLPRRRILAGTLGALSIATGLTALAPTFEVALASRTLAAAAHGLFWSLLVATAAVLAPPERLGRAVSIVLAGPAVAGAVGVPVAGAIGWTIGWRASFAAVAALMIAAAFAVAGLRLPDVPSQPPASSGRAAGMAPVVAIAIAGGLVLTGHFMLYTFVAPILQDIVGFDAGSRGVMLTIFGGAGVAGIMLSGPLSDRWPRHALSGVTVAFAASAASLTLLDRGLAAAAATVVIWGVLIGLLPPVFQARIVRTAPPAAQAAAGAAAITVLNIGIALGAAVGGGVLNAYGAAALAPAAAVVISVAAAGLLASDAVAAIRGQDDRKGRLAPAKGSPARS